MKLLVRNPREFREIQLQKDLTPKEDKFLFEIYLALIRVQNSEERVEFETLPRGGYPHEVEEALLNSANQQTRLLVAWTRLNTLLEAVECVFDDLSKVGDLFKG